MGTEIKMVQANQFFIGPKSRSAIKLSARVGTNTLLASKTSLKEVQQLIFTGIYRDKHIGDPSMASLVHGRMNRKLPVAMKQPASDPGLFCFDVANGGCGFLNGIQLMEAFMTNGEISQGMVIAGDAAPSRREKHTFPFTAAASALLLQQTEAPVGFRKFFSQSFPDHLRDHAGELKWMKPARLKKFSNVLEIQSGADYLTHCVDTASRTLDDFFSITGTGPEGFDLYIPSIIPSGFGELLARKMGLFERFVLPDRNWGQIHTAGLGFGLNKAWQSGRFKQSVNILLIGAGGGITITLAWYQKEKGL